MTHSQLCACAKSHVKYNQTPGLHVGPYHHPAKNYLPRAMHSVVFYSLCICLKLDMTAERDATV